MQGYGGWISIRNLPLEYWCKDTFEAIGNHFGGLVRISFNTLNLINLFEARIQVRQNLCGFMPASLEIKNNLSGNVSYSFLCS